MSKHKSGPSEWVTKMLAVIRTGNAQAAIAQIKAAPSAKDVAQLRALLHYHCGVKTLRTRQMMIDIQSL